MNLKITTKPVGTYEALSSFTSKCEGSSGLSCCWQASQDPSICCSWWFWISRILGELFLPSELVWASRLDLRSLPNISGWWLHNQPYLEMKTIKLKFQTPSMLSMKQNWLASDLKRKMEGLPTSTYTSHAVKALSFKVHLLHDTNCSNFVLYGISMSWPVTVLEQLHLAFRCLTTDDILFRALSVSSKNGLWPSCNEPTTQKTLSSNFLFSCIGVEWGKF